jgi:uncharacterized protein YegL
MPIQAEKATYKGPKAMPVLLLLDVSGSMKEDHGAKIDHLNKAVVEMLESLKKDVETFYVIGIVKFGGEHAEKHFPFTALDKIAWKPLSAEGGTPLGDALKMAKDMIEAKEDKVVAGRSWAVTAVLVSDGHPTDSWKKALDAFLGEGRSQKCDRWAMGIGSDVDEQMLRRFAKPKEKPGDPDKYVQGGAADIIAFFEKMSTHVSETAKKFDAGPNPLGSGLGGGVTVQSGADDDEQV